MPSAYAQVCRQYRTTTTEHDLRALRRRERFETEGAVEPVLRGYEMAIRADARITQVTPKVG